MNTYTSKRERIENPKSTLTMKIPKILITTDTISTHRSFITIRSCDTKKSTTVKSLVDKHVNFQQKRVNARLNDLNIKKKSFLAASKAMKASYRDCVHLEGVEKEVENVEHFVRYSFKINIVFFEFIFFLNIYPSIGHESNWSLPTTNK